MISGCQHKNDIKASHAQTPKPKVDGTDWAGNTWVLVCWNFQKKYPLTWEHSALCKGQQKPTEWKSESVCDSRRAGTRNALVSKDNKMPFRYFVPFPWFCPFLASLHKEGLSRMIRYNRFKLNVIKKLFWNRISRTTVTNKGGFCSAPASRLGLADYPAMSLQGVFTTVQNTWKSTAFGQVFPSGTSSARQAGIRSSSPLLKSLWLKAHMFPQIRSKKVILPLMKMLMNQLHSNAPSNNNKS